MPINLNELMPGMRARAEDLNENFVALKNVVESNTASLNTMADSKQNRLNTDIKGQIYVSTSTNAIDVLSPNTSLTIKKYLTQLNSIAAWEELEESQPAFVPYSVASGLVDVNGNPVFITKVDNTSVKINASSVPLVVCYPDGSKEIITQDVTLSGISTDGVYNIWVEKGTADISTRVKAAINSRSETYSPISASDICQPTFAISSGDTIGYPKASAFDNDINSWWGSSQIDSNILGQAYIGQNFGTTQSVKVIDLVQNDSDESSVSSVKVQYSSNGSTWTDAQTFNSLTKGSNILTLTTPISAQYVRILANSSIAHSGWGWAVAKISMYAASSGNDGDLNLQIGVKPYIPKKKTAGLWQINQYVPLGEFTRTSAVIANPISYTFNGKYLSPDVACATTAGTVTTYNHNLGSNNVKAALYLRCYTADQGYVIGDITEPLTLMQNTTPFFPMKFLPKIKPNTVTFTNGPYTLNSYLVISSTGAYAGATSANWKQFAIVERGF